MEHNMAVLDDIFYLVMVGVAPNYGVDTKLLLEDLGLLRTTYDGGNVKSVGAWVIDQTSKDGTANVACGWRSE